VKDISTKALIDKIKEAIEKQRIAREAAEKVAEEARKEKEQTKPSK
jgi:predicted GNAT family acetyltransferase